jgi:hypothetical protein
MQPFFVTNIRRFCSEGKKKPLIKTDERLSKKGGRNEDYPK